MIRRPPRSTQSRSSAASDVYKRQAAVPQQRDVTVGLTQVVHPRGDPGAEIGDLAGVGLSLIHISEPTRLLSISYAVFCLKKKIIKKSHTSNQ